MTTLVIKDFIETLEVVHNMKGETQTQQKMTEKNIKKKNHFSQR